jgi:hypothetical protein
VRSPSSNGAIVRTDYVRSKRIVALVIWHPNGRPDWVWHLDAKGLKHGAERYFFESGRKKWECWYEHGLQHGPQRQWDEHGRLLCETQFVLGTGRDLWWDGSQFVLSELREFVNGKRHGVEQWWASRRTLFEENHFYEGLEHGIFRQWDGQRLRRRFPIFFVHGKKVSRQRYLQAAISDPTLPIYRLTEDRPQRECRVPPEGLASKQLRKRAMR